MPVGTGTCCCQCEIANVNGDFLADCFVTTDEFKTMFLGISGSSSSDCSDFFTGGIPAPGSPGFMLLYNGFASGMNFTRTGRPDGVEIVAKSAAVPYMTDAFSARYAPESIHLSKGGKFLHFDYDLTKGTAPNHPITISTNCTDGCKIWYEPRLYSAVVMRQVLIADVPSSVDIIYGGITGSCAVLNGTLNAPFSSMNTFDGYAMSINFGVIGSPSGFFSIAGGTNILCNASASDPTLGPNLMGKDQGSVLQFRYPLFSSASIVSGSWPVVDDTNIAGSFCFGFTPGVTAQIVEIP